MIITEGVSEARLAAIEDMGLATIGARVGAVDVIAGKAHRDAVTDRVTDTARRGKARQRAVLETRRINVNDRLVTIRLEWVVWEALDAICKAEKVDVAWILRNYIHGTNLGTQLSRGLRVFAISYLVGFATDRTSARAATMPSIFPRPGSCGERDKPSDAARTNHRRRRSKP